MKEQDRPQEFSVNSNSSQLIDDARKVEQENESCSNKVSRKLSGVVFKIVTYLEVMSILEKERIQRIAPYQCEGKLEKLKPIKARQRKQKRRSARQIKMIDDSTIKEKDLENQSMGRKNSEKEIYFTDKKADKEEFDQKESNNSYSKDEKDSKSSQSNQDQFYPNYQRADDDLNQKLQNSKSNKKRQELIRDYEELPYEVNSYDHLPCVKKYAEDYSRSYEQRKKKFIYSFEQVSQMQRIHHIIKNKNCWTEFKRWICCLGGNQIDEINDGKMNRNETQTEAITDLSDFQAIQSEIAREDELRQEDFRAERKKIAEERERQERVDMSQENTHISGQNNRCMDGGLLDEDIQIRKTIKTKQSSDQANNFTLQSEKGWEKKQYKEKQKEKSQQMSKFSIGGVIGQRRKPKNPKKQKKDDAQLAHESSVKDSVPHAIQIKENSQYNIQQSKNEQNRKNAIKSKSKSGKKQKLIAQLFDDENDQEQVFDFNKQVLAKNKTKTGAQTDLVGDSEAQRGQENKSLAKSQTKTQQIIQSSNENGRNNINQNNIKVEPKQRYYRNQDVKEPQQDAYQQSGLLNQSQIEIKNEDKKGLNDNSFQPIKKNRKKNKQKMQDQVDNQQMMIDHQTIQQQMNSKKMLKNQASWEQRQSQSLAGLARSKNIDIKLVIKPTTLRDRSQGIDENMGDEVEQDFQIKLNPKQDQRKRVHKNLVTIKDAQSHTIDLDPTANNNHLVKNKLRRKKREKLLIDVDGEGDEQIVTMEEF